MLFLMAIYRKRSTCALPRDLLVQLVMFVDCVVPCMVLNRPLVPGLSVLDRLFWQLILSAVIMIQLCSFILALVDVPSFYYMLMICFLPVMIQITLLLSRSISVSSF